MYKVRGGELARGELVAVGVGGGSTGSGPVGGNLVGGGLVGDGLVRGGLIGDVFVKGGFTGEKESIAEGNEGVVGGQWPAGGTPL